MGPPWAPTVPGSRLVGVVDVPVLVVDDQAPFRKAARFVLDRTDGFTWVGDAATGEAAVEQARALQPHLVLLDVKLPGIDGVEAGRRIVAERPETVVFLCSTYDAPLDAPFAFIRKEELGPDLLRRLWAEHGELGPETGSATAGLGTENGVTPS
jgi:CheY-like chemotaxis protein